MLQATGEEGGKEDSGVGVPGVGCSREVEALVNGKDCWGCDTEGRGKGGPEDEAGKDGSPTEATSEPSRTMLDMFTVGLTEGIWAV